MKGGVILSSRCLIASYDNTGGGKQTVYFGMRDTQSSIAVCQVLQSVATSVITIVLTDQ